MKPRYIDFIHYNAEYDVFEIVALDQYYVTILKVLFFAISYFKEYSRQIRACHVLRTFYEEHSSE